MYNTSTAYKTEIKKPSRSFQCRITIGDRIFYNDDIVDVIIDSNIQPSDGFMIGSTTSTMLDLTLLNNGNTIYSINKIKVEIGLKIGNKIEYILMGYYNIDDIEKTDYTTKFTAFDNMIKFETPYFSDLGDTPTLQQLVNELANKTGVEFTGSLPSYTVKKLEGFTCREILSYVASVSGGNAIITREGKFTIVYPKESNYSINADNYFEYKREEVKYKIGKVTCQIKEKEIISKGSLGTDSMELLFENPWVNETILTDIYNRLNGFEYLGYDMKWQGDLSIDVGDIITCTDKKGIVRKLPILSQKLKYTGGLTSEIGGKGESKNKNSFSSNGNTTNKVNRVVTELLLVNKALINKANIQDLESVSIRTQNLEAKTVKIEEAIIDVAHIRDLEVISANIQELESENVIINNALINKADITQLNAVNAKINVLEVDSATIKNLLAGNITGENIQAGGITSDKLTIANGFITNAMIANLDVNKILAGDISTNKFRIVSDNGGIEIVGATQQFKDKNNRVRIQMGQDTQGNFNFILRGEDGTTTLIDHTGIKEKAIANDLIKENMIATDAIGEKQINYSSLITGLNNDTNTQLIKASKVAIDLTGQTLDIAFNKMETKVEEVKNMDWGGVNRALGTKEIRVSKALNGGVNQGHTMYKVLTKGLEVGKNLTVSFDFEYTNLVGVNGKFPSLSIQGMGDIRLWNRGSFNPYNFIAKITLGSTETKKIKIIYSFKITEDHLKNSYWSTNIRSDYLLGGNFSVSSFNVELGDKNTAWSQAPEDLEGEINRVKETTTSNSTTINVMQGEISTAINNTKIVKDGQTILLKDDYNRTVAKVDSINSTLGSHTTLINELTGKVTSVENKANTIERDLNGTKSIVSAHTNSINGLTSTVSNQGAEIIQLKNEINLKVNKSEVDKTINNLTTKLNNAEAKLTDSAFKLQIDKNKNTIYKVRYIRDWAVNGHFVEIKALNNLGENLAKGKRVTTSSSPSSSFPAINVTDDNLDSYCQLNSGTSWVKVDLGSIYENIDMLKVWHYWKDGRIYPGTKTEISSDGVNWTTVFDSNISGTYKETKEGHTIKLNDTSMATSIGTFNENGWEISHSRVGTMSRASAYGFKILGKANEKGEREEIGSLAEESGLTVLRANKVYATNVISVYESSNVIYVNPAVSTEGDGSQSKPYKTLNQCLHDRFYRGRATYLTTNVTIQVQGSGDLIDTSLNIIGFSGKGILTINFASTLVLKTNTVININSNSTSVILNGGRGGPTSNDGCRIVNGQSNPCILIANCTYVNIERFRFSSTVTSDAAIRVHASALKTLSNDYGNGFNNCVNATDNSNCFSFNESGSPRQNCYYVDGGSFYCVGARGQVTNVPGGTFYENIGYAKNHGNYTVRQSVQGSASGSGTVRTETWNMSSQSYNMQGWWNDGRDVMQGNWGYGNNIGYMIPPSSCRSTISGSSIKNVQIYIRRKSGGGISGSVSLYLKGSTQNSLGGGVNNYNQNYGYIGSLAWGQEAWFSVPNSVAEHLKSGVINSLCLYTSDGSDYFRSDGECTKIKITYQR
ncbi:MAG: hypothetical protein E6940_14970 [Clostridium septicum]|uniref:hypothetical protein n=1 Tax=Clostridium septicum TaxID=1504 RepID=UPI00258CCC0F|nr:hypothetical protein [Clostridium septicum]MDU1315330.1 hypothetical protein [Clostridium septicum]